MRAVFTARLVWLLIEISDNSREMENYDQPESHALCHRNLLECRGLELFIPSRLVVFCQYCDSSASPNRRPGITGPPARTGRPLPLTQREMRTEVRYEQPAHFPFQSSLTDYFSALTLASQIINLRHGIMGCQPRNDGRARAQSEHNTGRSFSGCCVRDSQSSANLLLSHSEDVLAHVFPLIKRNTRAHSAETRDSNPILSARPQVSINAEV